MQQSMSNRKTSETVIALHCSGGNAGQWRELALALGSDATLYTPEHRRIDGSTYSRCQNERPFTLADEALPTLQLIDRTEGRVHLVGHSYGGSLALHIALARPVRIASVALYEPCSFHLLGRLGNEATAEPDEIQTLATSIKAQVSAGNATGAMKEFVDYWSGAGTWRSLKPSHRDYLIGWALNAPIGFDALIDEGTRLLTYRHLHVPVKLFQGDRSPTPVKAISNALLGLLPNCSIDWLSGHGHMGPISHAESVARRIAAHVDCCSKTESALAISSTAGEGDSGSDNAMPDLTEKSSDVRNLKAA